MSAPQEIIGLVNKFKENEEEYTNKNYVEEDTKIEFINPFFKALGWDVDNEQDFSPEYKEVVFEKSLKIEGQSKAPDYSFRLGGTPIFFVEAKKPSVNIETDKNPAFQIRRYGWSAKLDLCILTDFEELAIYETTTKPNKNQSASIGRVKYYKYTDYIEKWDEIASIFSKESVLKGRLRKFIDDNSDVIKKGTGEVDSEFLEEIESWRLKLARNIALRNSNLDLNSLNFAVQITIDRILFLRIAEDRGIEKYKTLLELTKEKNIYEKLMELFKNADQKYNSGLFCLSASPKDYSNRDMITENIVIDDKVLKDIFKNLYYPNSPYEFSVISSDILGQVYEHFLGSTITLSKKHRASVKQKKEILKQGGVFYTPPYIVKYIVKNTVGKLIEKKTPNQISKMRILDPACGSGSFLIVAYQELLNYHLNYYTNMKRPPKNTIYFDKVYSEYRLTIREKKRILKNNIFGVDVDFSAVEITKLSLLLKVLEDQNKDDLESQQKLFPERVLPDLSDNIKCGNSLINFENINNEDLTSDEIRDINPFNWENEFETIINDGGFDVIIGNPPYVRYDNIKKNQREILSSSFDFAFDKFDLYILFIEKSIKLLKENGFHSFIVTDRFCNQKYGQNIREYLINNVNINKIIDFTEFKLFKGATVKNIVYFIKKEYSEENEIEIIKQDADLISDSKIGGEKHNILQSKFKKCPLKAFRLNYDSKMENLIKKIDKNSLKLNKICHCQYGFQTGKLNKFVFNENTNPEMRAKNPQAVKKFVKGVNIERYYINFTDDYVLYLPNELHRPAFKELFDNPKIIIKEIGESIIATYDEDKYYGNEKTVEVLPWYRIQSLDEKVIRKRKRNMDFDEINVSYSKKYNLKYILALLNSNLVNFYFKMLISDSVNVYPNNVKNLPICETNMENINRLAKLADEMIALFSKLLNETNTPNDIRLIEGQIKNTDNQINKLVYKIYNLTDEEIKIIEDNV